ncbi:hypothetical protein KUL113_13500 [Tenacibaculum sp. KUL113]|nr:hypothetical protein KUL113_13500 [Tenacibaculum sp. KUL113]
MQNDIARDKYIYAPMMNSAYRNNKQGHQQEVDETASSYIANLHLVNHGRVRVSDKFK